MIPNAKVCLYPKDTQEAVRVLSQLGRRALLLAGGTSSSLSKDPSVDTLVDITRFGYDSIELKDGFWHIGCNVRMQQLAEHQGIASLANSMLCDAAASVGSTPIRNAVTVGGNLVQLNRWSDPPGAFLALDSQVVLLGLEGKRTLSIDEFLSGSRNKVLKPGQLLIEVKVPAVDGRIGAFEKFARTATDFSIVDCAASLDLVGSKIRSCRLVVTGARSRPFRVAEAEAHLLGKRLSMANISKAAQLAREHTRAIPDTRTSVEYRTRMVEVVMSSVLHKCMTLSREGR